MKFNFFKNNKFNGLIDVPVIHFIVTSPLPDDFDSPLVTQLCSYQGTFVYILPSNFMLNKSWPLNFVQACMKASSKAIYIYSESLKHIQQCFTVPFNKNKLVDRSALP